jgi:hypothetical protein
MGIPTWLEAASAAGQAIGGIATVVGVAFAVHEVRAWREQKRAEKESQAAARALLAIRETCLHIEQWCSVLRAATSLDPPDAEDIRAAVRFGRPAAGSFSEQLRSAAIPVFLYLDDGEQHLIRGAEAMLMRMRLISRKMLGPSRVAPEGAGEVLDAVVAATAELNREANAVLLPIVRFKAARIDQQAGR